MVTRLQITDANKLKILSLDSNNPICIHMYIYTKTRVCARFAHASVSGLWWGCPLGLGGLFPGLLRGASLGHWRGLSLGP